MSWCPEQYIDRIKDVLTPDLLKPRYRFMADPENPTAGHCYHAAEALWHFLGGAASYWKPHVYREDDGITHWWLRHIDGAIADPTADQYYLAGEQPPYLKGRRCGFMTRAPSRPAAEIIRRVRIRHLMSSILTPVCIQVNRTPAPNGPRTVICTFDTETTGFIDKKLPLEHPDQPRIVQLGAILDDLDGKERMRLDVIIRHPLDKLPPLVLKNWLKAAEIHGISPEYADEVGVTEDIAIELFLDILAVAKTVVGHNIKNYDNDIIRCTVRRLLGADAPDPFARASNIFDTMAAGTPLCQIRMPRQAGYKSPKLIELHQHLFKEGFDGAHAAINDVLASRRCYYALQALALESHGGAKK